MQKRLTFYHCNLYRTENALKTTFVTVLYITFVSKVEIVLDECKIAENK